MKRQLLILTLLACSAIPAWASHTLSPTEYLMLYGGAVYDAAHHGAEGVSNNNTKKIVKKNKSRRDTNKSIKCSARKIDYTTVSDAFFNRSKITKSIISAANQYGVPADFALAVAFQETRFTQSARSTACAEGVFQLMPATAAELGVNPKSTTANIDGGVRYLRQLLKKYNGNQTLAAAAYNAGMGRVAKYGGVPPFKETRTYIDNIQNKWQNKFKHLLAGNADFKNYQQSTINNIANVDSSLKAQQSSRADVNQYYKTLESQIGNQTTIYDTWNQNSLLKNANLETYNQLIIASNNVANAFNQQNIKETVGFSISIKFGSGHAPDFIPFKPTMPDEYIEDDNDTCDLYEEGKIDSDCLEEDHEPVVATIMDFLRYEEVKHPEKFADIEIPSMKSDVTLAQAITLFKQYEAKV